MSDLPVLLPEAFGNVTGKGCQLKGPTVLQTDRRRLGHAVEIFRDLSIVDLDGVAALDLQRLDSPCAG